MKRVRAIDKHSGEFIKILHADEVTPEQRYAHHYACLDMGCSQSYHWRKSFRQDGNKIQIPATFVENHSSSHNKGCRYDFEKIAARHREIAFFQDGEFHLRINFPMGGAYSDMNVPRVPIDVKRLKSYWENTRPSYVGLNSMRALSEFLEKEFGSLESPQTDILKLHYQGKIYAWNDVYAASDHYENIINVPKSALDKLNESRLTIVRLSHEINPNDKGKRRFACEPQDARITGRLQKIQPVVVSASHEITDVFRQMCEAHTTALIAARPFSATRKKAGEFIPAKTNPVTLYVASMDQVAPISQSYWRPRPAQQLGFQFDFE